MDQKKYISKIVSAIYCFLEAEGLNKSIGSCWMFSWWPRWERGRQRWWGVEWFDPRPATLTPQGWIRNCHNFIQRVMKRLTQMLFVISFLVIDCHDLVWRFVRQLLDGHWASEVTAHVMGLTRWHEWAMVTSFVNVVVICFEKSLSGVYCSWNLTLFFFPFLPRTWYLTMLLLKWFEEYIPLVYCASTKTHFQRRCIYSKGCVQFFSTCRVYV